MKISAGMNRNHGGSTNGSRFQFLRKRWFSVLFLSSLLCLIMPVQEVWAQPEVSSDIVTHEPPPGEGTTEVEVSLYVIDIPEIDGPSQSFELDTYMTLNWTDERLASGKEKTYLNDIAQSKLATMWWPNVQFNNQIGEKDILSSMLRISPEGHVMYTERLQVMLYSTFYLRSFPFDSQIFHIELEPFGWSIKDTGLKIKEVEGEKKVLFYYKPDDSEWRIDNEIESEVVINTSPGTGLSYSTVMTDIRAERKIGFHIWKIFLPLALIIAISWAVFWIGAEPVSNRLSIAVIAFLTAVSFGFFIDSSLPKISYLTFMDGFITGIYIFMTLTVIEVLSTYLLARTGRDAVAMQVNSISRWAFPVAALIYLLAIILIFLR